MSYFLWFLVTRALLLFIYGLLAGYNTHFSKQDELVLAFSFGLVPLVGELIGVIALGALLIWLPYGIGSWIGGKFARYT